MKDRVCVTGVCFVRVGMRARERNGPVFPCKAHSVILPFEKSIRDVEA